MEWRAAEREAKLEAHAALIMHLAKKLQNYDLTTSAAQPQALASPPSVKPNASGCKRGGQPGHPADFKELLPPERVSETEVLTPP